jgi:collagen type III alpha
MATDTRTGKGPTPAKYDTFVAAQLAKAESRIRTLDLAAGLLGFLAATLAFAVLMAAIDSKWMLSGSARQTVLWLYLGGAAVYLYAMVLRPLRRRINPYYAARKVEATLPGAKNSVINWVDLHDQKLAPAIRSAVGQRAARDLGRADIDSAISGRRAGWAGGLAGAAIVAFLIAFFVLGRGPFFSLLGRTFAPFGTGGIPTRTQLEMIQPEGGNAVVTVGRPVTLAVRVGGRLPDPKGPEAVRLLYRYEESEPYQERLLQPESERAWGTTLSALEVRNGFWYRITGGDAHTPEYRISVRATAAVTEFLATYHFRPYVARIDAVSHERDLQALRGTEVRLWARTNRAVKDARLEWEGKDGLQRKEARLLPGDPQSFQVRMVIEEDGHYRLAFTSTDGETYIDPARHTVKAIEDKPPEVVLTQPGQDISLPANGLLRLQGKADDDIGVKEIVLRSQTDGGTKLQARPYRSPEKMRLADGGYPVHVDYADSFDLAAVKGEDGKPVALKAGMELEYWLEAADACDYPRPHVGASKHYKVRITEPDKDAARQQQERKKAAREQKKHEQQQDRQRKEEEQKRAEEREEQAAKNEEERGKTGEPKPEQGDPGKKGEKPGDDPTAGQPKNDGQENPSSKPNDGDLTPEQKEQEKRLRDALERQEQQQGKDSQKEEKRSDEGNKGEAKPDGQQGQGEAKPDKQQGEGQKGAEQGSAGQKAVGEGKDAGQQGAQGAGEEKKQGQQEAGQQPGEAKEGGQPGPMNGNKGESKPEGARGQAGQEARGEDKGNGQDKGKGQEAGSGRQQRAEGKPAGSPEQSRDAGQGKPEGTPGKEGAQAKADPKDAGAEGGKPENRRTLGEKKDQSGQGEPRGKAEEKSAGKGSPENPAAAKSGGMGDATSNSGEGKPNPQGGQNTAPGEPKPEGSGAGGGEPRAEDARPEDVARLVKDLLKSEDRQKREDAARKLEQIEEQARDARARDEARKMLEQLKKQGEDFAKEPKSGKGPMGDTTPSGTQGANSGGEPPAASGGRQPPVGGTPGGADAATGGGGKPGEGTRDGKGKEENREGDPKNPNAPGKAKGSGGQPAGNDPGNGRPGARTGTDRPPNANPGQAGQPSRPEAHRPGVLQLDDIRNKVDKKVLEDAHMTEEDYRKFLDAYEKAMRNRKPTPRKEKPPDTKAGEPLPSFGGQAVKPAAGGKDDPGADAKALPPPAYRDAYREFTKQLSRPRDEK